NGCRNACVVLGKAVANRQMIHAALPIRRRCGKLADFHSIRAGVTPVRCDSECYFVPLWTEGLHTKATCTKQQQKSRHKAGVLQGVVRVDYGWGATRLVPLTMVIRTRSPRRKISPSLTACT